MVCIVEDSCHVFCFGRVYKEEVACQNLDSKNQSYYIVPITIELRPDFETKVTSGFLVNPNDVCTVHLHL